MPDALSTAAGAASAGPSNPISEHIRNIGFSTRRSIADRPYFYFRCCRSPARLTWSVHEGLLTIASELEEKRVELKAPKQNINITGPEASYCRP